MLATANTTKTEAAFGKKMQVNGGGGGGDRRDDSGEILFQSFVGNAMVSSSSRDRSICSCLQRVGVGLGRVEGGGEALHMHVFICT